MFRILAIAAIAWMNVNGQSRVLKITGETHKVVLLSDGVVMAWGDGRYGQLGSGTVKVSNPPRVVVLPGKAIDVAAAESTSYALLENGTVYAWGRNRLGELGVGPSGPPDTPNPTVVPGIANAVHIDAYDHAAFAVLGDGGVMAWGSRAHGVIGDGMHPKRYGEDGQPAYSPVRVPKLPKVVHVSAGPHVTLALTDDGRVYSWGSNTHGALGRGPRREIPMDEPAEVPNLTGVVAIASGNGCSTILKKDGTVWVWGSNWYGQFGNGKRTDPPGVDSGWELVPQRVASIANVSAIAVGYTGRHSVVLLKDGTLRAWGSSDWGEIGAGVTGDYQERPVMPKVSGVRAIFAAGRSTFAVTADGSLWSWGAGGRGEWPFLKDTPVPTRIELPAH